MIKPAECPPIIRYLQVIQCTMHQLTWHFNDNECFMYKAVICVWNCLFIAKLWKNFQPTLRSPKNFQQTWSGKTNSLSCLILDLEFLDDLLKFSPLFIVGSAFICEQCSAAVMVFPALLGMLRLGEAIKRRVPSGKNGQGETATTGTLLIHS